MQIVSLFSRLGGEATVRLLTDTFYDYMDTLPEAQPIRVMHPTDLQSSRDKLYEFLTGWSGGPPLYIEKYGHPRLRARHLPFPIDTAARDQWLHCMNLALNDVVADQNLRIELSQHFSDIADFMRNTGIKE